MIEDELSPEERSRSFENTVRGCDSIVHDGIRNYIIAVIKDGKLPDDGSESAANAKRIISLLGIHKIKDRQVVFLMSWDDEAQDSACQLIGWTEFKRWKMDASVL